MKNIEISGKQIFWMLAITGYGVSDLLAITPAVKQAKQDAWISTLIATGIAILITFISSKVSRFYPTQTLIEVSQSILGKWVGKVIMVSYFIMWYTGTAITLRQSAEVVKEMLLPRTPIIMIVFPLLLLVVYATAQGFEVIARCSEVIGPIMYLVYTALVVLVWKEIQWHYVLPIYSNTGMLPILKGTLPPTSFLCVPSIMLMMFVPFMAEPSKASSRGIWGVGIAGIFLSVVTLVILGTLSPILTAKMWYPAFEAVRFISVGNFIQNLDAVIGVIWLSAAFIKISLYFFITCYGTAQWLGVKKWRKTIWVIAPIIIVLAFVPRNIVDISVTYPQTFWIPFVLPVNLVGIPCLLWLVGVIRNRRPQS